MIEENVDAELMGRFTVSVNQLQSFCRGELSAVEAYGKLIDAPRDSIPLEPLRKNRASHAWRAQWLAARIKEIGGKPPEGSGPWGAFVKLLETTAAALGDSTLIALLEEGEDHGLRDYRQDVEKLDVESARLVRELLLPDQIESRRVLSDLERPVVPSS